MTPYITTPTKIVAGLLVAWQLAGPTFALTLDELRNDSQLTPEKFIKAFADFQFELHEKVQDPKVFLATRKGDCDDFATLAADILGAKGYTARLVVVFMPRETHVVCYIEEVGGYLDYNNRKLASPLIPSDGSLNDVANKVAHSFRSTWFCVSEFTFTNGIRNFVFTDFPQGPQRNPAQEKTVASSDSN